MTARLAIPERVMLLGREWTILRPDPWTRPDSDGYCERSTRTIEIRPGLDDSYALEVYLHECLHAVFPGSVVSERAEEIITDNADKGLGDAVRGLILEEG